MLKKFFFVAMTFIVSGTGWLEGPAWGAVPEGESVAQVTHPDYRPGTVRHVVLFRYKDDVSEAQRDEVKTRFLNLARESQRDGRSYIVSIETGAQNSGEGADQGLQQGFIVTFRSEGDRNYYVGRPLVTDPAFLDPAHEAFKQFVGPLLAPNGVLVFDFTVDRAVPISAPAIHFTDSGARDRPALLFIHGFPLDHGMWDSQVARFAKEFRVITVDLRGFGASPTGAGPYTLDSLAEDVIGVLNRLRIPRATVVAHSMGGYVALRAMAKYPERFRSLVLSDSRAEADSNEAKLKRLSQVDALAKGQLEPFADSIVHGLFAESFAARQPAVVKAYRESTLRNSPVALQAGLLALMARPDSTNVLFSIRVPTLVIFGAEDHLISPSVGRELSAKIAGAQFALVESAGHVPSVENPDRFNELLAAFLTHAL
jgi:pimeloyl-ACP methyl ester carboxylesterase